MLIEFILIAAFVATGVLFLGFVVLIGLAIYVATINKKEIIEGAKELDADVYAQLTRRDHCTRIFDDRVVSVIKELVKQGRIKRHPKLVLFCYSPSFPISAIAIWAAIGLIVFLVTVVVNFL